ncbi:hypothetical protein ACFX2C_044392 [Malus domestica]
MDDTEKVLRWRAALTETANISGCHFMGGYESKFIDKIVEEISVHLFNLTELNVAKHPVGIKSRVLDVDNLLRAEKNDVRMVGIWGIGGIGKTTIARAVYNLVANRFEGSCFLENVREESIQHGGLVKLQNILLSKIVGGMEVQVTNVHEGINVIHRRFSQKRVVLVLDDVNELDQLYKLVGGPDWSDMFGLGSRIIITTRDKNLLTQYHVSFIYDVKELNDDEALELFSVNAFPRKRLPDDYVKLANTVVQYARGLPLALEVLGSVLCGGSTEEWQDALDGYKKVPNASIQETLKISYNSLENPVKEVFLYIACFFKGENKDHVIQILEGCGLNPKNGIRILKEKTLLKINEENHIWMHDFIEEMGKEVVRQESPDEPGERSRLWFHEDVYQVLMADTGTRKIKSIIVKFPDPDETPLSATTSTFSEMRNLKMFINSNAHFSGDIGYLPSELRFIDWPKFPFQSLPLNLNPKKLVKLNMPHSRMSELGDGFKGLKNLKYINLEFCEMLEKFPDASGFPNLEDLNLNYCTSLVEVHESVGNLSNLAALSLKGCHNLTMFPGVINLNSAKYINLGDCRMLKYFPIIGTIMECLTNLDLSNTAIDHLHSSIEKLVSLEVLTLEDCENLVYLPASIYCLQHLGSINLRGCRSLATFPEWSSQVFGNISHALWYLNFGGCKSLMEIPELPENVEWVNAADCVSLQRVARLSNILENEESNMIECIILFNCQKLVHWLANEAFLHSLFLFLNQSEFDVVVPGSKVPKFFTHRQDWLEHVSKSKFSVEIPQNFKLENRGLAICAAVDIYKTGKESMASESGVETQQKEKQFLPSDFGRCYFAARIDINAESVACRSFYFEAKDMKSAHMWLLYIPFVKFACCPLPPFTCYVSLEQTSQGSVFCKSYGVHLVMRQGENLEDDKVDEDDLESAEHVNCEGCRMLGYFPRLLAIRMECLTLLELSRTTISELPSSTGYLVNLQLLGLQECDKLTNLPCSIYEFKHLLGINLFGCRNLVSFPKWSPESLSNNSITYLFVSRCKSLEEIPELPPNVEHVDASDCVSLKCFAKLSNIVEHKESQMIKFVSLINCQKLCDNLAHGMARIENVSQNEVSLRSIIHTCKQSPFQVVFPGNEVPEWFAHHKDFGELTTTSALSLRIPLNFKLENRGLAICAVLENRQKIKEIQQSSFDLSICTSTIKFNGIAVIKRSLYFEETYIRSPHVWMLYFPFAHLADRPLPPFECQVVLEHTPGGLVCCRSYGVNLVKPDLENED